MGVITFLILIRLCLAEQKNRPRRGHYTMPWVPILPAIGIFFNFTLCCGLDALTWLYFGIFLAIGVLIYFSYGLYHSKLELDNVTRGEFEESLIVYEPDISREQDTRTPSIIVSNGERSRHSDRGSPSLSTLSETKSNKYRPPFINDPDSSEHSSEHHT